MAAVRKQCNTNTPPRLGAHFLSDLTPFSVGLGPCGRAQPLRVEAEHLAVSAAQHRPRAERHPPLLIPRQRREILDHARGAVVVVLGHRRVEAVPEPHALPTVDAEHMPGIEHEAVDRLARLLPHLPELGRKVPSRGAGEPDGVPRRDAQPASQLHHLGAASLALCPHHADHARAPSSSVLVLRGHGVALLELGAAARGAVGQPDQGVGVEARVVHVVERRHAEVVGDG
mmetsp:Transcript_38887/g.91763  ORF Transcript_38887/g.91763 Transcript_38887/m.91763 type:complete len:229 (+) Transcript_38887:157-843(+)